MILKYEICFDNHRMESGTQEEKWFHYSYLPELIPCDITFGNVQANEKKNSTGEWLLLYIWYQDYFTSGFSPLTWSPQIS